MTMKEFEDIFSRHLNKRYRTAVWSVACVGILACGGRATPTPATLPAEPQPCSDSAPLPKISSTSEETLSVDVSENRWVPISGGTFQMRSEAPMPSHETVEISLEDFEIQATEVTVSQYAACVDADACTDELLERPYANDKCNWLHRKETDFSAYPMNCVNWFDARDYCQFIGGELPSESQYEYALRNGGKAERFPWGNEAPNCSQGILSRNGGDGCGTFHTGPVCSVPDGNTSDGLCDLIGNVWEWTADVAHMDFKEIPRDGTPLSVGPTIDRILRGSSYDGNPWVMRLQKINPSHTSDEGIGFRCVRNPSGAAKKVVESKDTVKFQNDWVRIPGGIFTMGSQSDELGRYVLVERRIKVRPFSMLKSEVTVADYSACVDAGACEDVPGFDSTCTWHFSSRDNYPMNCVGKEGAEAFCKWKGGRLPSEAQWEYAASSLGSRRPYPWGEGAPTCERARYATNGGFGCGEGRLAEVCEQPEGNTEQGLCDMAGNLAEMVADNVHQDYTNAPKNDRPWMKNGEDVWYFSTRGGSFISQESRDLKNVYPGQGIAGTAVGFRCVK